MLNNEKWEQKNKELLELQELKKIISKKIHLLKCSLRQHEKQQQQTTNNKQNSIAFKMFGKRLKDLTAEEYKAYYNARQKINREKRKSMAGMN